MYAHICIHTYIHIRFWPHCTVSFHNFKSQDFKLSVSNPKSKYAAYLSVPSQISNCQGLGRKNKHEILKTDRIVNGAYLWAALRLLVQKT